MFGRKKNKVHSPVKGCVIQLEDVSDPVFSQKMMGDGFAVVPENGDIYPAVAGTVISIFPAKHAITLYSESGIEYLIHMGLDTVELGGAGFEIFVKENQKVAINDILARMDLSYLAEQQKESTVVAVFPNLDKEISIREGSAEANQEIGVIK